MKVSSVRTDKSTPVSAYGADIKTPGIYKADSHIADRGIRLIVTHAEHKFVLQPGVGTARLMAAHGCLSEKWIPVKEKITITFDSTDEE